MPGNALATGLKPRKSIRDLDTELSLDKDRLRLMIQQGVPASAFQSWHLS